MSDLYRLTVMVRPRRAELLCQRLLECGLVEELTAVECRGYGRQKGHLENYSEDEYSIDFLPKVMIQGLLKHSDSDHVIDLINATCRTGRIGDGKIFLQPTETVIAIG
jgi:nitrogen regulatory protein P-II 1